jgi:hypothetical protein
MVPTGFAFTKDILHYNMVDHHNKVTLSYQSRHWKQWLDILITFTLSVLRHFQQYGSYIVAVSFIGGGNPSTQRKPPLEAVAGNIEK